MDGTQILTLGLGLEAPWILKDQRLDTAVSPHRLELILPSNSGHLKNVTRYDEVNHGKIEDINEEKILYPLLRYLPSRSVSTR